MSTPAHVSGLSGPSGLHAVPPVEQEQSKGQGMWILQQSMMEQPVMGRKQRPLPATLNHAVTINLETKVRDQTMTFEKVVIFLTQQLTANGVSGVNGQNATRLANLERKATCEHMLSLHSLAEADVKETQECQLRCNH